MTKMFLWAYLILFLALISDERVVAQSNSNQALTRPSLPYVIDPNAIAVVVKTDAEMYEEGATVFVKVSIQNNSEARFYLSAPAPWRAVDLEVRDSGGNLVAPAGKRDPHDWIPMIPTSIPVDAGTSYLVAGPDSVMPPQSPREWTALSKWGYAPLTPGTYSIAAKPHVWAWTNDRNIAADVYHVHSNVVVIKINPSDTH